MKLLIRITIFQSVLKCQGAEWRSFHQFCPKLPWQRPLGNRKNWSGWTTFTQIPSIWWKIVKIGPVDPGTALLSLKKKKETEGKIYSPVGNLSEQAKLLHATRWLHAFQHVRMPSIIAACCMQKLHATIVHETMT